MRLPLMVAILFVVLCASKAEAILVDFTQVTRAPSAILVIDGVTITAESSFIDLGSSSISTIKGVGLGVGGLLPSGSLDRLMELTITDENWLASGQDIREAQLTLAVDGEITAVTIQPYFTFLGPNGPEPLPTFIMGYEIWTPGFVSLQMLQHVDVGSPTTFSFPFFPGSGVPGPNMIRNIGVYDDWDATRIGLTGYMNQQGLTSVTAQFGFSIVSLEYTPRHVPEPTTLSLLALSGACLLLKRRHG